MASPSLFEYRTGSSLGHRLDPRAKLGMVFLFSMAAATAGWTGSSIAAVLLLGGLHVLGISFLSLIRAFRFFLLFLGLIALTRALVVPGEALVQFAGLSVSAAGLNQGGLIALRFFNMMVLGLAFSATTRPPDLNAALQWIARPIPFIPEKRLGMIFSLALRFLPMILRQAGETTLAFRARNGRAGKNPLRLTVFLATALMTRVLGSADAAAMAMEARCYTHERTMAPFSPSGWELPALLAGAALCAVLVWI